MPNRTLSEAETIGGADPGQGDGRGRTISSVVVGMARTVWVAISPARG